MNYIGSKKSLLPFIFYAVNHTVSNLDDKVFCDAFAGTGIVGRKFKGKVKQVISNDLERYSYVLNRNYIGTSEPIPYAKELISDLNNADIKTNNFIFNEFSDGGSKDRKYFSKYNGNKIDTYRTYLESVKDNISEDDYYFLLCSILEAVDSVANTTSMYGSYLKDLKPAAQKNIILSPCLPLVTHQDNLVFNMDANLLLTKVCGDILYLDPPYNERQYGANYHVLSTIVESQPFVNQSQFTFTPKSMDLSGKTGMCEYKKSQYCSKATAKDSLDSLLLSANFPYIFMSYNNEGLLSPDEIKDIMSKYGDYSFITQKYKRYKADSNRYNSADSVVEYIHILKKKNKDKD